MLNNYLLFMRDFQKIDWYRNGGEGISLWSIYDFDAFQEYGHEEKHRAEIKEDDINLECLEKLKYIEEMLHDLVRLLRKSFLHQREHVTG